MKSHFTNLAKQMHERRSSQSTPTRAATLQEAEMAPEKVPAKEIAVGIKKSILNRKGDVVTDELATERANNIAAWLMGTWVT